MGGGLCDHRVSSLALAKSLTTIIYPDKLTKGVSWLALWIELSTCTEQPNPASCLRRKFRDKSATDKNIAWNK